MPCNYVYSIIAANLNNQQKYEIKFQSAICSRNLLSDNITLRNIKRKANTVNEHRNLTSMHVRNQSIRLIPEIVTTQQQAELVILFRHSVVEAKWNADIRSCLWLAGSGSSVRQFAAAVPGTLAADRPDGAGRRRRGRQRWCPLSFRLYGCRLSGLNTRRRTDSLIITEKPTENRVARHGYSNAHLLMIVC